MPMFNALAVAFGFSVGKIWFMKGKGGAPWGHLMTCLGRHTEKITCLMNDSSRDVGCTHQTKF